MSMQIIIASDSHGRSDVLRALEKAYPKADLYLHCGDLEDHSESFPKWIFVRGNNDWLGSMPEARVIRAGDHKIFMSHSHRFPYRDKDKAMAKVAKEQGCDIVLYGHTHVSDVHFVRDVLVINPGAISFPRDGKLPSYAVLTIGDDGQTSVEIIHEDKWPFTQSEIQEKRRFWNW